MSRHRSKPKSEYAIQTVLNAMRMLEAFSSEDQLGVSELSRRLDLHKNNVFRLLATLEEGGYIEQCPVTEEYRLGIGCLVLGQAYLRSHTLLKRSRPILEALAEKVGETAHISVLRGKQAVSLDGAQSDHGIVAGLRIGHGAPVHCTASGKILIACAPEAEREQHQQDLLSAEVERCTEATIHDRQKLLEHLRGVGVQGYAVDLEEWESGLRCAAAPVFGPDGDLVAAISISGPSFRLSEDRLHGDAVAAVVAAAAALSQALGHAES